MENEAKQNNVSKWEDVTKRVIFSIAQARKKKKEEKEGNSQK